MPAHTTVKFGAAATDTVEQQLLQFFSHLFRECTEEYRIGQSLCRVPNSLCPIKKGNVCVNRL